MSQSHLLRVLAAFVVLPLAIWGVPADAQGPAMPKLVNIGTNPPGSVFYAMGSALAKVVSGAAPFQMGVQPYSGTSTFLPLLNSGELEFGIVNAVDMGMAYPGPHRVKVGGRNPFPHSPHTRLLMRGGMLVVGLLVTRDSPYKSIHELKAKRWTGEYPAHLASWYVMTGALASAGMTWNDVKVVPVPGGNDGVDALVQGRADVSFHGLNSAKTREGDAARGLRHLSIDCSPQGQERLKAAIPGYYHRLVKAGSGTAVLEDTCMINYDLYLVTHKALPDAVVQTTFKAIWDNIDKLPALNPALKDWTRERAVDPSVTMPYHPAAIHFYRERGAWKAEMDQVQQKLLSIQ